jgi:hypothetical protein
MVATGQEEAAQKWAIELTEYVNTRMNGAVRLYVEKNASGTVLHWFLSSDSEESMRNDWSRVESDATYNQYLNESMSFFAEQGTRDELLMALP